LNGLGGDPKLLLDEVYAWTSGHPYMTQKLCARLTEAGPTPGTEEERVRDLAHKVFLERGQESDANLRHAVDRFVSRARWSEMLEFYRRLLRGGRLPAGGKNSIGEELRLTGMVAEYSDGKHLQLRVRNLIFRRIFDETWAARCEGQRELSVLLGEWRKHDQHPDYLLTGKQLEHARAWAQAHAHDVTREESEFLRASVERTGREYRRRMQFSAAATLLLVAPFAVALRRISIQDFVKSKDDMAAELKQKSKEAGEKALAAHDAQEKYERLAVDIANSQRRLDKVEDEKRLAEDNLKSAKVKLEESREQMVALSKQRDFLKKERDDAKSQYESSVRNGERIRVEDFNSAERIQAQQKKIDLLLEQLGRCRPDAAPASSRKGVE
jgi:hypothetical protein